jgi:hypothetical protein
MLIYEYIEYDTMEYYSTVKLRASVCTQGMSVQSLNGARQAKMFQNVLYALPNPKCLSQEEASC